MPDHNPFAVRIQELARQMREFAGHTQGADSFAQPQGPRAGVGRAIARMFRK